MKYFILFLFALMFVSCASGNKERQIQDQAAQETAVNDGQTLGTTIQDLIRSSQTLTEFQKKQLEIIIGVNKKTADALAEKSFKLRSVLIKELLSGKADRRRVELIKKNISGVEADRLKNTFDTVEKISDIVKFDPKSDKFVDDLRGRLETTLD